VSFLLDTNVISEVSKPSPNPAVLSWLDRNEPQLYLSAMSIAEIRSGIEQLAPGRRRQFLTSQFLENLPLRFGSRVLTVTAEIAEAWGILAARSIRSGTNMGVFDGFLAATCLTRGLTMATRNTKHFAPLGVPVFNPWS
jgi:predicted nucleic acid-binding protein